MKRSEIFKQKMLEEREARCSQIKSILESLSLSDKLVYDIYMEADSDLELLNIGLIIFGEEYEGNELGRILLAFIKKKKIEIEENIRQAHVGNIQNIG